MSKVFTTTSNFLLEPVTVSWLLDAAIFGGVVKILNSVLDAFIVTWFDRKQIVDFQLQYQVLDLLAYQRVIGAMNNSAFFWDVFRNIANVEMPQAC